jgi:hypothetical protein
MVSAGPGMRGSVLRSTSTPEGRTDGQIGGHIRGWIRGGQRDRNEGRKKEERGL